MIRRLTGFAIVVGLGIGACNWRGNEHADAHSNSLFHAVVSRVD